MKKLILLLCSLLFFAFIPNTIAQTLDQIIDMHFDAAKQDKFNKLKTITITYEIKNGNKKGILKEFHKRNSKLRIEEIYGKDTTIKVYNGKTAWEITPKNHKPKTLTGINFEKIKFLADLDGYFYCWRNKGHKLKLIGKEKLGRENVYKIQCTKSNGDQAELFLDADKYLLTKCIQRIKENGKVNIEEKVINNYKKVGGIPFPFKLEVTSNGNTRIEKVKDIKLDKELPDSIFAKPKTL